MIKKNCFSQAAFKDKLHIKEILKYLDLLSETREARRLKKKKNKNVKICQTRILYDMKVSFRNEGKIKTFSDKRELKEINSQPTCSIRNAKGSFFQAKGKCYQKGNRSSNMKEAGFIESKKC